MQKNIKRKLQKIFFTTKNFLHYKILHMSFGEKIIFGGLGICTLALFLPWIESVGGGGQDVIISGLHPFSLILGRVGYLLLGIIILTNVIIFKTPSSSLSDYLVKNTLSKIFIFTGGAIFLLSLQTLFFIQGIQVFSSEIVYANGIILSLTGACITIIGGLILRKEKMKNNQTGIIRNNKVDTQILNGNEGKDNMKLPF